MYKCKYCDKEYNSKRSCTYHELHYCINNPNLVPIKRSTYKRSDSKLGGWKCKYCDLILRTRNELYDHYKIDHKDLYLSTIGVPWNKGLTSDTNNSIKRGRDLRRIGYKSGKYNLSRSMSEITKKKISESMKIAHKEGRAHNIGSCRKNSVPSYPEKYFINVIENNFSDKNYIREYPISRYSLDFAWVNKKKCIEIDGEQHYRFEYQIINDKKKDSILLNDGWEILRIRWIDLYNNPKYWIDIAKKFIDNAT